MLSAALANARHSHRRSGGEAALQVEAAKSPTETRAGRIAGIDVARAMALFGMISVHVLSAFDGLTVVWHHQIAGGRSAALFAVLAGVSISLMTGGHHPRAGADLAAARAGLFTRAVVIGGIGLLLGPLQSLVAVVLTYYAVLFLVGLPFVGLRWRPLAVLSGCWLVLAPVVSHLVRTPFGPPPPFVNPSLGRVVTEPVQLITELTFTGLYPAVTWLSYLLAGMALGRCVLASRRFAAKLMVLGASLAGASWGVSWILLNPIGGLAQLRATPLETRVGAYNIDIGLTAGLPGSTPTSSWWWLAVMAPHSGTPLDLAHTIGTSLLILGLCLLIASQFPRVVLPLSAVGAMPLTLYTAHVVALHLHLGPERGSTALYVAHVSAAIAVAVIWRWMWGSGPLERLCGAAARAGSNVVRNRRALRHPRLTLMPSRHSTAHATGPGASHGSTRARRSH